MMAETDAGAQQNVTIKVEDDQGVSEVKSCYIWLAESTPSNLFDETEKVSRVKRKRCAVYTCDNVSGQTTTSGHRSISFHSFPRDERTRAVWTELCKRTDKFSPRSSFICSDHFNPDDYVKFGSSEKKNRLRPGTIPSFNLPEICSSRAEYKVMVHKMALVKRMESCHDEEEENSDISMLNSSSRNEHSSNQNEDDLIESFEEENGDADFRTTPHSSSQNEKHPEHSLDFTCDVVTISSSEDEDTDKVGAGEDPKEVTNRRLDLLKHQYDYLQRSFEELKTETNAEIKRLNSIIENKEILFSRELREVLSVFLKPEKVDSIVNQTVW